MKPLYRNIFWLFGIVAIVIMLFSFDMDYVNLWENVRKASWWFFAVMGVWVVIYFLNALSWSFIIHNGEKRHEIPFSRIYKLSISGFALNYATPFGLMGGEPYRIMELAPWIGTERATSSVILYVMMHIFSHICFWLVSILLFILFYHVTFGVGVFLALTGLVLLFLVYLFILGYKNGMVVKTFHLLCHLPWIGKKSEHFLEKYLPSLVKIDEQISQLHKRKKGTFYRSFIAEFCARFLTSAEIFFILKILTPDVSFLDCVIIMAFTSLFANIFFFSPMQLGAREGGFALAVSGLCLSGAFGVYVGLISRVRELLWIAIGVGLMKIGNKKPEEIPPSALLFDYGGTLDTGGRHWAQLLWEAYQRTAVPLDYEAFYAAYVATERNLSPNIAPQDTFDVVLRKKIAMQFTLAGLPDDLQEKQNLIKDYVESVVIEEIGKSRMLLRFYHKKYKIAIVSNFYGNLKTVLADYGLCPYVDEIVDSSVVGVRKPQPDIWKIAMDRLNVPITRTLVIGDSVKNDIEPAQSLGCRTLHYQGGDLKQLIETKIEQIR